MCYNLNIMKTQLKPILKWVGGKRQLLDRIIPLIPTDINTYYEPFAGGLAVLLALEPNKAVINDLNVDLIDFYKDVKSNPIKLINTIKTFKNEKDEFYKIRSMDRSEDYSSIDSVIKSARFYYLNKTAYNGLYRVNSSGFFNAPFGAYKSFSLDECNLKGVSDYFNKNKVKFYNESYEKVLKKVKEGDFVYLDPPYFDTFTQYTKGQFGKEEQIKLKKWCDKLNKKGVKFLLSNSDTDFINELYKDYKIEKVVVKRYINCDGKNRNNFTEVLVRNY